MDIEKFISKAKQDYEMQKCWNDAEPQTHWEWIEMYLRQLHKESHPVERAVMPNEVLAGGKIDINQIVSRIKQLLLLNKEMLEEAPPDYKKMAESNVLTVLLHWIENQRGA